MKRPWHKGAVPHTPHAVLVAVLQRFVDGVCRPCDAFDMKSDLKLEFANQCDVNVLMMFRTLLEELGVAQESLRFKPTDMRCALEDMAQKRRQQGIILNQSSWPDKHWVSSIARKILVMVGHLRNLLPRTYRYQQVVQKLPEQPRQQLGAMIDTISGRPQEPKRRRQLAKQVSAASSVSIPSVPHDSSSDGGEVDMECGGEEEQQTSPDIELSPSPIDSPTDRPPPADALPGSSATAHFLGQAGQGSMEAALRDAAATPLPPQRGASGLKHMKTWCARECCCPWVFYCCPSERM